MKTGSSQVRCTDVAIGIAETLVGFEGGIMSGSTSAPPIPVRDYSKELYLCDCV